MQKLLAHRPSRPSAHRRVAAFAAWQIVAALALLGALAVLVILAVSHRSSGGSFASSSPSPTPISSRKARASWYDVSPGSLAGRRAAPGEFTAAHDSLPIGTLVRVTHLKNHKSVLVRITDRGIHNRNVQLDLCKDAAEQLGMLRQGVARVRMEVLPEVHTGAPPATETAAP
ncbi:MAG: septal ring lytic transglycosylase RlpA family protein [Chthoniobacterales bacterium]